MLTADLRERRQLLALAAGFLVCFALLAVQIDRAFGLPAHPLLLHIPVVFDPILALVTLAFVVKPEWRRRYAVPWAAFAVVCLAATVLTAGAGNTFIDQRPFVSHVLHDHKEAGEKLRLIMFIFTGLILVTVWLESPIGPGWSVGAALGALLAVGALGAGFFTVRTGHLGAKSVWAHEDGGGRGGGGFPPGGRFP